MKLTREHYEVFASLIGWHSHSLPPDFIAEFTMYLADNNPKFDSHIFQKAVNRAKPENRSFQ